MNNISSSVCSSHALPFPSIFGAEILSLNAALVSNYSLSVGPFYYLNHGTVDVKNTNFCNVSITYTHPGQNDVVNVQIYLPTDSWNGKYQGLGGNGFTAGLSELTVYSMAGAVGEGYAAATTDGGHSSVDLSQDVEAWGLLSPGNVNLYALQNFGSVSLNDTAYIAKDIIHSFYGQTPKYSYFSGCSGGGRQGMMLAQKYPEAYDGIAASAPAINWNRIFSNIYWPQFIMNQLGQYPRACELDEITAAAVSACDALDGVTDGLITYPGLCDFDASTMVNTTFNCSDTGLDMKVSSAAAIVANAAWSGIKSVNGSSLWYGVNKGADLTNSEDGLAATTCSSNRTCTGNPLYLSLWLNVIVERDPELDLSTISHEDFDRIFHQAYQQFSSLIETADPDLSAFRARGGKIVGYHGLADEVILTNGTQHYYDAVTALDPDVHDFYRFFEAPGLGHCWNLDGIYPDDTFDSLVKWVESGIAPDSLNGANYLKTAERLLCPYPQYAKYNGTGDSNSRSSYYCTL